MFVASRTSFDPAPFYALQGLVGLISMVLATLIVITQNRQMQSQLAERLAHIDLEDRAGPTLLEDFHLLLSPCREEPRVPVLGRRKRG